MRKNRIFFRKCSYPFYKVGKNDTSCKLMKIVGAFRDTFFVCGKTDFLRQEEARQTGSFDRETGFFFCASVNRFFMQD